MSRSQKQTADYFPHEVMHKRTLFVLESKYKNDGYAFWFKLLEILCETEGHCYDCNPPENWEYLLAKTLVSDELAKEIFDTLFNLGAIDKELWEKKIVWVQNLVDNLGSMYAKRVTDTPQKPAIRDGNKAIRDGKPQSKVEYSKVKESIVKNVDTRAENILNILNKAAKKRFTKVHSHTRARIRQNQDDDMKLVISHKALQWGEDEKMRKYLRQETLFSPAHFDTYLADAKEWTEGGGPDEIYLKAYNKYRIETIEEKQELLREGGQEASRKIEILDFDQWKEKASVEGTLPEILS